MSEQPVEITNSNTEAVETISNSNDTLSAKDRRIEAAKKLGLSYDESLNMSQSELDKRVADPSYEHKQLFLEAHSKTSPEADDAMAAIDYMTSDTPETSTDLANAPTEVLPVVTNEVADQTLPETDQLSKKDYLVSLAKAKVFSIFTGSRNAELRETGKQDIENGKKIRGGMKYAIGAVGILAASTVVAKYTGFGIEGVAHAAEGAPTGATGITEHPVQMEQAPLSAHAEHPVQMEQAPGVSQSDTTSHSSEFAQHYSDKNHEGNKVNAFGGTERGIVEKADYGKLDGDYLNRYIDTHDRMTAHNVEKLVNARFQEKYGLDADKFNSDWGKHEREVMKHEYLSDSGHTLSEKGQRAHELHMKELEDGKVIKVTSEEAISKYGLSVNSFIKEGDLKGGIDDKAYAAGAIHDAVYILLDQDGKVKHAEIGNCGNEIFRGSFTTVNTPTTPGGSTPPTVDHPPKVPPETNTPKGPTFGADDKDHQYGNNGEIHGNDGPEEQQPAGPGNSTNPNPEQTPRPEPAPAPEAPAPTQDQPATGPVNPSH